MTARIIAAVLSSRATNANLSITYFLVLANHDDLPDLSTTFARTEFWHINSTCAVRCWRSEAVATCHQLRDGCRRRPALSRSFEPRVIRFCKPDGVVANWKLPQLISWETRSTDGASRARRDRFTDQPTFRRRFHQVAIQPTMPSNVQVIIEAGSGMGAGSERVMVTLSAISTSMPPP